MEEADALGDRVIIMAEGEVQCCGTPMFLKQVYGKQNSLESEFEYYDFTVNQSIYSTGAGYTLKFTTVPNTNTELIVSTVQKHIPNAFLKSQKFANASELALILPDENNVNSLFPNLFSELTKRRTELGILTMSLQLTTMDEVFVR